MAQKQVVNIITQWTDIFFNSRTGFINVTNLDGLNRFFGSDEIDELMTLTAGRQRQYISINSFGIDPFTKRPKRSKGTLKQIRNIAIDLDQYTKDLTIDEAKDILTSMILEETIPEPNLILTSRGIQLFYRIDGGASPEMQWLSRYITVQFIDKLELLGADSRASDVSRLMRVPNSVNERNSALVGYEIWNDIPYTLEQLKSYTDFIDYRNRKRRKKADVIDIKKTGRRKSLFFNVNNARLDDLATLFDVRDANFTHLRDEFIYIYAYHYSLISKSLNGVMNHLETYYKGIKSDDTEAYTRKEFSSTVKSAFEDARSFYEKYKADNYQIIYRAQDGIIKPVKTETLIKKLKITVDEQHELRTIYDPIFKRERERERLRAYRLKNGRKTLENYKKEREDAKNERIKTINEMFKRGMSNKKIAKKLNISVSTVKRAKRSINHE